MKWAPMGMQAHRATGYTYLGAAGYIQVHASMCKDMMPAGVHHQFIASALRSALGSWSTTYTTLRLLFGLSCPLHNDACNDGWICAHTNRKKGSRLAAKAISIEGATRHLAAAIFPIYILLYCNCTLV